MSPSASDPNLLAVLQVSLLLAFLITTGALMTLALRGRLRVRPIRFSWYGGGPVILWPGAFLFVVLVLTVYAAFEHDYRLLSLGAGYTVGALCWCLAVRMSQAILVTDEQLIRSLYDPGEILVWREVEDFFVTPDGRKNQYVFFFREATGQRGRFEVAVPVSQDLRFRKLVSRLVEHRDMHSIAAYG